ncbi:catalytic [Dorcoceras hygrometricum]|uniref:Catalytic n=1 Tax=Dorcoceras hygrometricum TaxID=472368 RepID=A0A2Z7D4X7_9LAMI|nr:catalytic [Dorcoceras hygrometricum]
MVKTKSSDGIRVSIVLSVVFSTSIAVVLVLGFFSQKIEVFFRFDSGSRGESRVKIAELLAAAPGRDEFRAVISSEFPPRFNSSACTTMPAAARRANNELEQGVARARAAIRKAASITTNSSVITIKNNGDILSSKIYRNPRAFYRSYMEMERRFKIFVYEEGDLPLVHDGPCKDIYSSEGRFIHEMEHGTNRFRTRNAKAAHVYFLPFSVAWMVKYLYNPNTYELTPLKEFVSDYVRLISTKHPFWNRTQGADHFMLSCHDWGPRATQGNPFLYNTSIRVLCNANSSEGFNPQKDVSLPEIHLYGGSINPKLRLPPKPNIARPYLAFFAGGVQAQSGLSFSTIGKAMTMTFNGYEVASPRIVEAIYAECIPVILSDHYVLPFSDVLKWEAFSIQVELYDIPRLKEILMAVSEEKYVELKKGLRSVRRHFVLNQPVDRFDVFHMILHSVWLRRLNLRSVV